MFRDNRMKARIRAGEACLGIWIQSGSPAVAEMAARAGYDVVLIDLEHGAGDLEDLGHMLRAVQTTEATAMVRPPGKDPFLLNRILDLGAEALLLPMVRDGAEAAAVTTACRYPPEGKRGYAWPVVRASGYGTAADRFSRANTDLLLAVQIESAEAVDNAAAIASVPGVDMVFVGPFDLAGSLGHPQESGHPEVVARIREVEAAARAAGKPLGTIPRSDVDAAGLLAEGYAFVVLTSDIFLLGEGMGRSLAGVRRS